MSEDELSTEFRDAANSMTRLFKLAREAKQSQTVAREEGYQMALYDLLAAIQTNPSLDAKLWAQQVLLGYDPHAQANSGHSNEDNTGSNEAVTAQLDSNNQSSPLLLQGSEETYHLGDKRRGGEPVEGPEETEKRQRTQHQQQQSS